ncbi:uncharacterized protein LOC125683376 isoform X2 [Ostrea edulis]|uniref:uncharacterized protein LOC125683376 isoform X2 n=1 Tax=Ostrea edulis TaxID=37623 RepID=UPI0020961D12|nr:uncharacterized protein LOC125683376 isoform X2 [Ostrea edulis]
MKELLSAVQNLCQKWKSISLREQMKTKNFYIMIAFLAATSMSLWLLSNPTPNFNTIVAQTHKQINNFKNIPSNIRSSSQEDFHVDQKLLKKLGFDVDPNDPEDVLKFSIEEVKKINATINKPIIAVATLPKSFDKTMALIKSASQFLPEVPIYIYDLGLSYHKHLQLTVHCNKTSSCSVRMFEFDDYPSHLRDISVPSYRPVLIQKLLNDNGTVIWVEPSEDSFISGDIKPLLKRAQSEGIVAWTSKYPVSTITYDKMYKYFKASADQYYFLETAQANHLILHNTEELHSQVMLPWVKCALSSDCINPVGASDTGCTDRKPLYLYRGCHKYDVAALNIILGQVFHYDESHYKTKEKLFGVPEEKHSTLSGIPMHA